MTTAILTNISAPSTCAQSLRCPVTVSFVQCLCGWRMSETIWYLISLLELVSCLAGESEGHIFDCKSPEEILQHVYPLLGCINKH